MKAWKTPDVYLHEQLKRISGAERTAFAVTAIMGLLAHGYTFFNKLYNYDELPNTPGGFMGAALNRWFLELMGRGSSHILGGSYSLPLFNGLVSVLLLSVCAFLITRMFEVRSRLLSACIGGFVIVFPAITSMFFFMFLSLYYSVGILLSVLAAFVVVRAPGKLLGNLAAVIMIACSLGTYQAYFSNTVCLFMISIILCCAFGEEEQPWKEILFLALRYVCILGLGMVLYMILNRIFLQLWDVTLALGSYQGLDEMGQITAAEFVGAFGQCYESFVGLTRENIRFLNNNRLLIHGFRWMVLLLVVSTAVVFWRRRGEWVKKGFLLAALLLFPVGMFLVYIMAPKADFYTLMGYGVVFLPILVLVWADAGVKLEGNFPIAIQWLTAGISVVMLTVYVWFANGSYMGMEYTKMHDMSYFQTMITQIKSVEGYSDELKLVLIGNSIDDETNRAGSLLKSVFEIDGKSESNVKKTLGLYLITNYLGYMPEICGYEETLEWAAREEVKQMPCYPTEGSIQVIDDTVVVKLSE